MTHMEHALSLAKRALGSVSPNPAVGAVVVNHGEVVGEGWTQPPGNAHAEVMAIKQAGTRAKGSTLYVTLEPCSHYGRTPPCAQAIIDAGVTEVRASLLDPNPRVDGKGIAALESAGIKTIVGDGEEPARELMEAYLKHVVTGLPFVTAKFAMSLDGKIATSSGDSKWITGAESRKFVHQLRAESDAIMVGINTALADDPQLTARDDSGPLESQPLRIVVDSNARLPESAKMLNQPGRTLLATTVEENEHIRRLRDRGVEIVTLQGGNGSVDLAGLMRYLGDNQVTNVFVEGGGTLLGSLFDLGLVDKVVGFVAPTIIGGAKAPSPVGGVGASSMADAIKLHGVRVMQFGSDVALIGYCEEVGDVHRNR